MVSFEFIILLFQTSNSPPLFPNIVILKLYPTYLDDNFSRVNLIVFEINRTTREASLYFYQHQYDHLLIIDKLDM